MRAIRLALLACAAAIASLCLVPGTGIAATSEDAKVLATLSAGSVYASRGQMGDFAGDIEQRLASKTAELRKRGFEVKMALVPPITGEDPFTYAARIRARLAFDGTVVVTTPTGPVGAAGPRSADSLRGAFRAGKVDELTSPTQRLIAASEIALPPPPATRSGIRELLVLIGLTLLGGAWAISWGLRREQRKARATASETRARLRVCLDAVAARIGILDDGGELPPRAADLLAGARADHDEAAAAVAGNGPDDHDRALLRVRRALERIQRAGDDLGKPMPMDNPFLGLCSVDPAHGPAFAVARLDGRPQPVPVCDACRSRIDAGDTPKRRLIPVAGRPVPFDEADIRFPSLPD
ncbi:MAG: hypothetical protein IT200_14005 [Thermoleophilia bacterium]|nr:hypothetical protein [Thermoleophilia bacterium]